MRTKTSNFEDESEFVRWVREHGEDYYEEYKDKVTDWRTELDDGSYTVKRFKGVAFKPNTIYLVRNWSKHLEGEYNSEYYFFYYWRPNFIKSDTYYNPKYYTPHQGIMMRVEGTRGGRNIPETIEQISMKWIEIPKITFLNWNFNPLEVKR